MSDKIAISIKEAAWRLGVGRTLLYEEIESGQLATVKVGKRRIIRTEDLNAYLVAKRQIEKAA